MNFGWGAAAPLSPGEGAGTELNLLGDNLLIDLDDKTLQCLMGGPSTGFAACISGQPGEATSSGSKRPRGEGEGEIMAAVPGDEGDEGEDSEEGRCGRGGRGGKKARAPGSDAATVKAHREKARRERLNECFEELARLCDPSGKMTRTDRISIVQDAIRALGAVRVENNQLRQLNKFLEERVRHLETERAQGMYQQAMMQQQQQQQHMVLAQQAQAGEGPSADAAAEAGGSGGPGGHAAPAAAQPQPQPATAAAAQQDAAAAPPPQPQQQQQQHPAAAMVPPGMMLVPMSMAAAAQQAPPGAYAHHPFYVMKADSRDPSLAASGSGAGAGAVMGMPPGGGLPAPGGGAAFVMPGGGLAASAPPPPHVLPANAPPLSWLPAPDISQDQKLRPPAA